MNTVKHGGVGIMPLGGFASGGTVTLHKVNGIIS